MSLIFGFFLAAALAPATPSGPAAWLSDNDYPAGAKRRHEEGRVGFELLISPEGRVARCTIESSSGFPELDENTCVALTARSKWKPATDENDVATYSLYKGRMTWWHPDRRGNIPRKGPPPPPAPNLALQVERLPDGSTDAIVALIVKVDPSGHIVVCQPSAREKAAEILVRTACEQAKSMYNSQTLDNAGEPVGVITGYSVSFTATMK
ncbi:MAG: energy transducer TonB [Sphingobium sp.]|nr:MAG: energy transducer TonB [Sphingobium sp.]